MAFINFKVFSLKNRGKGDLSDVTPLEVELLSQYFESDSISTLEEVTTAGNTTSKGIVMDNTKKVSGSDEKKFLQVNQNDIRITAYTGDGEFPDTEARVQVETNGGVLIQGESAQINIKEGNITGQNETFRGLEYSTDYSPNLTDRSLIDKGYVEARFAEIGTSQNLIKVTYAELLNLKNTSALVPGQTYLLTNYETKYEQPVSGELIFSGVTEPLYILATDIDTLHNQCKSKLYPQDIVYYSIQQRAGSDKGFIYRRIDTYLNNDIGTDWRHIKYRRWAVNVVNLLTVGVSYIIGDVVTDFSGVIHVCTKNHVYTGTENNLFWFELWFRNGSFVSNSYESIRLRTSDYAPITIPVNPNVFEDFFMFDIVDSNMSNYIECRDIEEVFYNTVITGEFKNNKITVNNFNYCTFNNFSINNIHASFSQNIIGDFKGNTINSVVQSFFNNIIKEGTENTFNGTFHNNISTNRLSRSDLQDFISNTFVDLDWTLIKNFCSGNTFIRIAASEIGTEFAYNFINRYLIGCTLGNYVRNLNIQTNTGSLINWTMEQLDGNEFNSDSLPLFSENIYPRLYRRAGEFAYTYYYTYTDNFGDTIIENLI